MAKVPGMFSNGGVPKNLEWDENNPPTRNECNARVDNVHNDDCDGECEKIPLTELETQLVNEFREWARAGMNVASISVDVVETDLLVNALVSYLDVDLTELNLHYQRAKLERMQLLRVRNKDAVRRARFGLDPTNPIIGPDGRPL